VDAVNGFDAFVISVLCAAGTSVFISRAEETSGWRQLSCLTQAAFLCCADIYFTGVAVYRAWSWVLSL
jgi:hypothetical protein